MSCRCRKCRDKLQIESYSKKPEQLRRASNVYGSNSHNHINAHTQNEKLRSGNVSSPIVSAKPASSIEPIMSEKPVISIEPKVKSSNSAILETSDSVTLKPGQVLKFNKGISGNDNSGGFIIGPIGDTIIFKSAGMYRFVFTFAVEDSAPNSIYIATNKSDPNHVSFQTLTVYNDGVNNCSTMLPIKENTEVKFIHPGGKNSTDIKFVGPVRLEFYELP